MKWRQHLAPLVAGVAIGLCVLMIRIVFVTGASMEPALRKGDICIVLKGLTAKPGDMVLYQRPPNRPTVHRVLRVTNDGSLVTQGDANPIPDFDTVKPEQIIGPVVVVVPVGAALTGWKQATMDATLLNHPE